QQSFTQTIKAGRKAIRSTLKQTGASSASVAFVSHGKIVWSQTFGRVNTAGKKPSPTTKYGIASVGKVVTAVAVMQLVDAGKISLDAPVARYVPDFTMQSPQYKQITVRMLLNHSSGLMGSTFRSAFLYNDPDPAAHDTLLAGLASQRLKAAPGEFSVYCNDGFALAELLVERVSGESFTDFVKASFTDPLGMTNTATPESNFDRSRLARTYVDVAGGTEVIDALSGVIGSGGIYSTAEDLCKFAGIFMDDPGYAPARGVLSTESRAAMAAYEFEKGIWPEPGATICALMTLRPRSYRRADPAPGTRSSQPSCCSMC
ncbi:MAG: serine hydrolase domain-containing protein, partial [Bacillota bacterium]